MPFSEVSISNMALARLGVTVPFAAGDGTVAGIDATEPSARIRAQQVQLWYSTVRDLIGRDFPFGNTTTYAALTLASDGESETWGDLWENAWAYPSDCLFLRGFVWPASGTLLVPWTEIATWAPLTTAKWAIGTFGGAKVIFANGVDEDNPIVEYSARQSDATDLDVDVADALAWRLAQELAVPVLGVDGGRGIRDWCERNYAVAIDKAKRVSANEQDPLYELNDGRWLASRTS